MKSSKDPTFDPKLIQEALRSHLTSQAVRSPDQTPFTKVITDSRQTNRGSLFVAIAGEKLNGQNFIHSALEQGAAGIICTPDYLTLHPDLPKKFPAHFYCVDSVQDAYRTLAHWWRKQFEIPVIAVAGSAGKTTTKEFLAAMLTGKFHSVLKTVGSQNGFLGIPMTLLELRAQHQVAVVEVGIDDVGAMIQHMALLEPTHAVLTSIGPEHLEKLIDLPTVAHEETLALLETGKSGGHLLINLDDPWISKSVDLTTGMSRSFYSLQTDTKFAPTLFGKIVTIDSEQEGLALSLDGQNLGVLPLPLPGKHNALNLLSAISVSKSLGMTVDQMKVGLAPFKGAEGRSQIKTLNLPHAKEIKVLCDYYNAQPVSVAAGLEVLAQLGNKDRKKHAVLGDMLELGPQEESLHRGLAPQIVALKIEHLFLFGERMRWLQDELSKLRFQGTVQHFDSKDSLAKTLKSSLQTGDVVIIKGSRSMKMEVIWEELQH